MAAGGDGRLCGEAWCGLADADRMVAGMGSWPRGGDGVVADWWGGRGSEQDRMETNRLEWSGMELNKIGGTQKPTQTDMLRPEFSVVARIAWHKDTCTV